jgi:hypothetical protein
MAVFKPEAAARAEISCIRFWPYLAGQQLTG